MQRVQFIAHRGARILHIDLSHLRDADALERVAGEAARHLRAEPPDSAYVAIDVTGVPYSLRLTRLLAERAVANSSRVCARAVVGIPQVAGVSVEEVARFVARPIEAFPTLGEALDWLAEQAAP